MIVINILLIIILLIIIIFFYFEPYIFKHNLKSNNEYGSAKFASVNEIKNNFDKVNLSNITDTGIPVYFDSKLNNVWFDNKTPHYVYLGSTGSGKSVTAVIPLCTFISNSKNKRSVFITDPKGEIFNTTSKQFKDNGYDILTLDFRNPEYSNRINILEPIIKEYELYMKYDNDSKREKNESKRLEYNNKAISHLAEANRLINSVSQMVMKEDMPSKDPFWMNSSKNLLEGLIAFFMEEYKLGKIKRYQITMSSIYNFQNSTNKKDNFERFKSIINNKEYGLKSKDNLTPILNASDATYKSIVATFGERMAIFSDTNVLNITSDCDFDFDVLGKKPTVLYMIVPDEDKTYYFLVSVIVGLMYKELVKQANKNNDKKLKYNIEWILDEFANCPPLTDIEAMVSVARSRGMRFNFFIQSFSQLINVYGKEVSQIILDNCGLIFLKTNTQDTAEEISKRLGKKTIKVNSVNQSSATNSYSQGMSTSLQSRELMTAEEILKLQYKTIIFPIIGNPIYRKTIMYNKFKCYKSGNIKRTKRELKELKNTFYTMDNIDVNKEEVLSQEKEMNEIDYFMKDQLDQYKKHFINLKNTLEKTIKTAFNFKIIETDNYKAYLEIEFLNSINQQIKSKIKSRIDSSNYELIFTDKKIEIHSKGILEIDK